MYHFSTPHLKDRREPKPNDIVWLVPIRYWELKNEPEMFEIRSIHKDVSGMVSACGHHSGYGHEVHVTLSSFNWFYDKQNAIDVQALLAKIPSIIVTDDTAKIVTSILNQAKPREQIKAAIPFDRVRTSEPEILFDKGDGTFFGSTISSPG